MAEKKDEKRNRLEEDRDCIMEESLLEDAECRNMKL